MRGRRGLLVAVGVAAVLTAGGVVAQAGTARPGIEPRSATVVEATPTGSADPAAGFRSPRTHPTVALPVRLRIRAIGVDTPLVRLGLDPQGAVEVPSSWQKAGWYTGSARPGQPGPAVLLGHVDSTSGPAVFYRLAQLRPGDPVEVFRADGTRVVFRVTGRQEVAKSRFPTDLVYAPTLEPSLRLVTCAGSFDAKAGHYRDNVIVSAMPG
jgi:sortase (surface protein transpeptidase)